jgi:hypothetical protein
MKKMVTTDATWRRETDAATTVIGDDGDSGGGGGRTAAQYWENLHVAQYWRG